MIHQLEAIMNHNIVGKDTNYLYKSCI